MQSAQRQYPTQKRAGLSEGFNQLARERGETRWTGEGINLQGSMRAYGAIARTTTSARQPPARKPSHQAPTQRGSSGSTDSLQTRPHVDRRVGRKLNFPHAPFQESITFPNRHFPNMLQNLRTCVHSEKVCVEIEGKSSQQVAHCWTKT